MTVNPSVVLDLSKIERPHTAYPYRVCMPKATDLVRFGKRIDCDTYTPKVEYVEGIAVILKKNIEAHTFRVISYTKQLVFQRSYSYFRDVYLLGMTVNNIVMPRSEVDYINRYNGCFSSAKRKINGIDTVTFHKDDYMNTTLYLMPDDYQSDSTQRYVTTKSPYHKAASAYFYTETTTINCVVTVTRARSREPYQFFALASGELVEISPFYNGENGERFEEDTDAFRIRRNYTIMDPFGDLNFPHKVVPVMAFLDRNDHTLAWEVRNKSDSICGLRKWQTVRQAIRTDQNDSFHFVSRTLTATFVTLKNNASINDTKFKCLSAEIQNEIDSVYLSDYNETHEMVGHPQVYSAVGGLYVVWQPLQARSLRALANHTEQVRESVTTPPPPTPTESAANVTTSGRRRRREATTDAHQELEYTTDVSFIQLQYTYDVLRDYINNALRHIADTWCREQRRTAAILKELAKINPSNVLSAIYERPIAARLAGDVIALSECVAVDQTSVRILKDMRILDGDKLINCYSRPLVVFNFVNSTRTEFGQLGENNEILLGTYRTENCDLPNRKIFVAGDMGYEYRDYVFRNQTGLESVEWVDTLNALNIEPLENTDFVALELYTRGEMRAANVFDLESIMLEYNSQKQHLRYLVSRVAAHTPTYLTGFNDFMAGLGSVGEGLGSVLGAVGGAITGVVGAVTSFLSNPFGAFLALGVVLAFVIIVWLMFQRQTAAAARPLDYFFPYANRVETQVTVDAEKDKETPSSSDDEEEYASTVAGRQKKGGASQVGGRAPSARPQDYKRPKEPPPYSEQDALRMLQALRRLDDRERQNRRGGGDAGGGGKDGVRLRPRNILDRLRRRPYQRLSQISSDGEEV